MRRLYLFFLLLLITQTAFSQQLNGFTGKSGTIQEMIENGVGEIVAIGTTTSSVKKDKDIYFAIINKKGEKRLEKNIGRKGDEEGVSLLQGFDGTYFLIGYTTRQKQKKGWIINVDRNGKVLWDKIVTTLGESQLRDIVQMEDGTLWAVGEQNQQLSLFHFKENGETIQTISITGINGTATSLIKLENGNLIISGQEKLGKERQVFLLEATLTGEIIWKQTFPKEEIMISEDCIQTYDGGFVLVGFTKPIRDKQAIVKTNSKGAILWAQTFGGETYGENATAVIQMPNGDLMVVGKTTFHKKGAKKSDFWLHWLGEEEGQPIWEEPKNFGAGYNDEAHSVLLLRDGTIRLGGFKGGFKGKQTWIVPFMPTISEKIAQNATLKVEYIALREPNNNHYIDAGENGYIHYRLTNISSVDAVNIEGKITLIHKEKGFSTATKVHINRIPAGQSKLVGIPLSATESVRSGMNNISVEFKAANSQEPIFLTDWVESLKKPTPQIEFALAPLLSDSSHYFETPTKLVLKLKNIGDAVAENFTLQIKFPNRLRAAIQEEFSVPTLLPDEETFIPLDFTISGNYLKEHFSINCLAYDKNYQYQSQYKIDRIISNAVSVNTSSFTGVDWVLPNQSSQLPGTIISVTDSILPIKIKAVSTQPIPKSSFQVYVNKQIIPVFNQEQSRELSINTLAGDSLVLDASQGRYTHTYIENIPLKKGENQIYVKVENKAGHNETSTLTVNYEPIKPTLHILSIGVPYDDLRYTTTDAKYIVEKFNQQRGLLYSKEIEVSSLLNTPSTTKAGEIEKALERLKTFSKINRIKSNDVLVLFISAHGYPDEDKQEFRIQGSDFDNLYPAATSIAFSDIVDNLTAISCRKLLFFDACYSGNTIQNLAALEAIPNLEILLSSSYNEQSYEDKKWEHGAFTKAILECFEQSKSTPPNTALTMEDIYAYIKKRVPALVKKIKSKTPITQTPRLIISKGTVAAPIFKILN